MHKEFKVLKDYKEFKELKEIILLINMWILRAETLKITYIYQRTNSYMTIYLKEFIVVLIFKEVYLLLIGMNHHIMVYKINFGTIKK